MESLNIYEILVRQHERMLNAYILGFVEDPGTAQDIAQESFIRAYRRLDSLRDKEAFPAWLRSIARNLVLDRRRKGEPELATDPEILAGMEDIFSVFDDPSLGDVWQERLDLVKKCFEQLPDTLTSVLRLFYWERCRTQAIAEKMSLSLATILKRMERGRAELRRCVETHAGLSEI